MNMRGVRGVSREPFHGSNRGGGRYAEVQTWISGLWVVGG
jgi:hypothetical protein